jgi:hypothetical protein
LFQGLVQGGQLPARASIPAESGQFRACQRSGRFRNVQLPNCLAAQSLIESYKILMEK